MKNSNSFKKEKLQERIQQMVSSYLKSMSDIRFNLVSITRVELNYDNSKANVYWDTFDSDKKEELREALPKASGKLRSQMSGVLNIRQVPSINFCYDSQFEDEKKIVDILKQEQDSRKN